MSVYTITHIFIFITSLAAIPQCHDKLTQNFWT